MQIIWHGHSCFEIVTAPAKNGQVKIVVDPYSEEIGIKPPKLEADILLITHQHKNHNNKKGVGGSPFAVEGRGEYEIKNIFIRGIGSWHDSTQGKDKGENVIYTMETEELRLCHLGDLGQKELTEEQLEQIGDVDVLMIPVGGGYAISGKEAVKIMSQIEPKITVPMHYHLPKLKIKLESIDQFLKSHGIKTIEPLNKLTIKKKDISTEEAKIIVLKP